MQGEGGHVVQTGLLTTLIVLVICPSNPSHSTPGYHIIMTITLNVVASPPNASKMKSVCPADVPVEQYLFIYCVPAFLLT